MNDARAPDPATLSFAQALFQRRATFTLIFLVANVLMFLLTSLVGNSQGEGAYLQTLINFGAKVNILIDSEGEYWRFVAPVFLHGGIVHLLMNMYGLWVLGPYVERLYGSAKFVFFWIVTGIGGVVASYLSVQPEMAADGGIVARFLFKTGDAVSVGASGALFGLIGVLFVFGIKFRHELPEGFKRAFGTGMLPTILINIFIGYAIPVIDNAAHLGGLVTGALLALVIGYKRIGERGSVAYLWHLLQFAALALVVVSFAFVAYNYTGARPSLDNITNLTPTNPLTARSYLDAINDAQNAFLQTLSDENPAPAEAALPKLADAPSLDETSGTLKNDLQNLLERARDFTRQEPARRRTRAALSELRQLIEEFNAWQTRHREWVTNEGERYGIQLREPQPNESPQNGEPQNNQPQSR